jgi:hypothetical protein
MRTFTRTTPLFLVGRGRGPDHRLSLCTGEAACRWDDDERRGALPGRRTFR